MLCFPLANLHSAEGNHNICNRDGKVQIIIPPCNCMCLNEGGIINKKKKIEILLVNNSPLKLKTLFWKSGRKGHLIIGNYQRKP